MKEKIQEIIEKALNKAKKDNNWPDFEMPAINVDYPKNEQFGDYTSNISMMLAKLVGKSPMEIANQIVILLNCYVVNGSNNAGKLQLFEKIEIAAPGYLNFYLSNSYFQNVCAEIIDKENHFGDEVIKEEKVMVEYSQPNTHKEFHIGHLRNVFIGNTLVNVFKKSGYDVTAANYIGDTGTHIAKCLWGITKFHANEDLDTIENKAEFLGKVYTEAVKAIDENPEYEQEFKELQNKFEKGDEFLVSLWEKTKQWSLDEFTQIYNILGVNFDVYFWESEEEQAGKKMLPDLLKTNVIKESQGAVIADLERENLGVLVLARKDGSALYGLKDIPLAIKKFNEFKINKSIYVVDARQSLYLKQLFKILELIGFKKDMFHVGYEFVSLKGSETMSSRKGNIITAKSLIGSVIEKVKQKFPETGIATEIGLGALKFYMLKYSPQTKIEFNIEESVSLNGATGPYVQYAHARICSILEKAKAAGFEMNKSSELSVLKDERELLLMRELNKFPELIKEISQSYEVHRLPHYAISLADKFHSFYASCKVIDPENKDLTDARLILVDSVRIVLGETLRLIGVSAPEKM